MKCSSRNTIITALIFLTVFVVPLVFSYRLINAFYLPKRVALAVFVVLISSFWACGAIKNVFEQGWVAVRSTPLSRIVILFVCWAFFSIFRSSNIVVSFDAFLFLLETVVLFFAAIYFIDTEKKITVLLRVVLITATLIALLGILQYYGFDFKTAFGFTKQQAHANKYKIFSTLGHPNFMAAYLISAFPLGVVFLCLSKGLTRLFYLFVSLAIFYCIYISRSKGAWLGYGISSIVFFYLIFTTYREEVKKRKKSIALFTISGVIFLVLSVSLLQYFSPQKSSPLEQVKKTLSIDFSANRARLIMWQTTLLMIKERPLAGFGFGAYPLFYQSYQGDFLQNTDKLDYYLEIYRPGKEAHNDYLEIFAELGVVGIVLFLLIIVIFFRSGSSYIKQSKGRVSGYHLLGLMTGCAAVLGHALVSFPLLQVPPLMNLWLFMGLVMGAPYRRADEVSCQTDHERSFLIIPFFLQGFVIVGSFFLVFLLLRPLYASSLYISAHNSMIRKDYDKTLSIASKALEYDQNDADLHLLMGAAYHKKKQYIMAEQEYRKSFLLNPDYMIVFNLGIIKEDRGDMAGAEKNYWEALRLHPDLSEAYKRLSRMYKKRGDQQKYLELYTKRMKYEYKERKFK